MTPEEEEEEEAEEEETWRRPAAEEEEAEQEEMWRGIQRVSPLPKPHPTRPALLLVMTSVWSCCHIFDAGSCGRRCLASFSQASFAAQAASLQLAWPHFTLTTLTSVLPSSSRVV